MLRLAINSKVTSARAGRAILVFMLATAALGASSSCRATGQSGAPEKAAAPAPQVSAARMLEHIRVLASDAFEGRAPGSAGEEMTVAYLTEQLRAFGLAPGNPDGTYVQEVPLVGYTTTARGRLAVGAKEIPLDGADQWVAVLRAPAVNLVDKEVLFVGYGVVAPELGWDDYKGVDTRGKVLVMLVNDPPVAAPGDPTALDERMFKGRAMTYYGRWTYKFEIAAVKKAAAVLLIHETGPAGYPYEVVKSSWARENFSIASKDAAANEPVQINAWIALPTAQALFAASGKNFAALKNAAARKDFRPVALGAKFSAQAESQIRVVKSQNVVARLPGSDPRLQAENIVFTAHWDHLGRDPALTGDQIFNGAADNASGVAMLLELARVFAVRKPLPKRSVLFLAVTAEEKGLLGAKYYAAHPLYPLETSLANFNMDVTNLWGRTRDVVSVGMGQTTLDDLLVVAASERQRTVGRESEPEKGGYFRSDHFEFAKAGVPAMSFSGGSDYIGKPADFAQQMRDRYTKADYHKPSDEVKPDWDLSGAAEDAELLLDLATRVVNGATWPTWKPDSEFRARRTNKP